MYNNLQANQSGQSESEKTSDAKLKSTQLELPWQVELYTEGGAVRLRMKQNNASPLPL